MSDHAVAQLLRRKTILEIERDSLFDAMAKLLAHMYLVDAGPDGRQTVLVCGVAIDDRQLEVALRNAQLVLRDEGDAATVRARRANRQARALQ
jgi:hypothetical protein